MQLYAFNASKRPIPVLQAERHINYICLECGGAVRRRGGLHRIDHFFHLDATRACRQNGKSMRHLQTQLVLQRLLPPGEASLEKAFPEIARIADIFWDKHRLVFEIQCSSISPQEIQARNRAYQSLGFQVVWILHDHLYNSYRLTSAEHFLRPHTHYFTNINEQGEGHFYDQAKKRGPPLTIDLTRPSFRNFQNKLPVDLAARKEWKLSFPGDLFHHFSRFHAANEPAIWKEFFYSLKNTLSRYYRIFFQYLLEKACR